MTATAPRDTPSRRRFLATGAVGAALAAASGCSPEPRRRSAAGSEAGTGVRQSGVTSPQQRAALVLSYDLVPGLSGPAGARALREVFARWAFPRSVTVTVGVGPALPARLGVPVPVGLRELPGFPGDRLDSGWCGGDVLVKVGADDHVTTAVEAARLTRLAAGTLRVRWRQRGFLPVTPAGETPRNLLGFKDGSAQPTPEECERWVWGADGGTFLVVRRIHIRVDDFARLALGRQEEVIGRRRASGAPIGGRREHDEVDIFAKTPEGRYVLPLHSHVRAASPRPDGGARMLRRGYSYDEGPDDRGLLFLGFMKDPALFVRVQERLAARDELSRFIEHRGSAVAYVLPGAGPREALGTPLLG
ncbi:Dyp-type peroxidase [Streptomyces sp. NPDC047072]|uniref:Dyp-type peroxidase n=1 Tax=Streptomyces sp. NPDC047072 TaxID=3154809 RepID=UPI0033C41E5C